MRKAIWIIVWASQVLWAKDPLTLTDIPAVMNRFFQYHVANKELNEVLIKRSFKLYIEQFDSEKIYLLQDEVDPYLQMSDRQARAILEKVKNGDFSDFVALNGVTQKSIFRSRNMRPSLEGELITQEISGEWEMPPSHSHYASNMKELRERQKQKVSRFLSYHQYREDLSTRDRRQRAFSLVEKRFIRFENPYVFHDAFSQPLSKERSQHFLTLHILKAFAKSLDAHTSFFSEDEANEMRMNLEKQFEGAGVVLSEGIDGIIVTDIIKGSPADHSSEIAVNDLVVEVDGESVVEKPFEEVLNLMKKNGTSSVELGLKRGKIGRNQMMLFQFWRVKLPKKPIVMEDDRLTYTYEPYGNGIIAKFTLNSFYENGDDFNSEKDMRKALKTLKKIGPIKGLVLDLRENAGGFLSQAVKVAGLFISSGVVVISKYGRGEVHYLRSIDGRNFYSGPLVILTSKLSASASEIVAQALQDYGVGIVVGDRTTFGKGSIQFQTVTDAKADYFFKVTVGKYYTVSGRTTQIEGVKADILVPTAYSFYMVGERYLEYPLPSDKIPSAYKDSLQDLDSKTKRWFERNYLPNVQKPVSIWRKMLPSLQKNSAYRLEHDKNYQLFLNKLEQIKAKQNGGIVKESRADRKKNFGVEDLQMSEAVNIVKDMIFLEAQTRQKAGLSYTEDGKFPLLQAQ